MSKNTPAILFAKAVIKMRRLFALFFLILFAVTAKRLDIPSLTANSSRHAMSSVSERREPQANTSRASMKKALSLLEKRLLLQFPSRKQTGNGSRNTASKSLNPSFLSLTAFSLNLIRILKTKISFSTRTLDPSTSRFESRLCRMAR